METQHSSKFDCNQCGQKCNTDEKLKVHESSHVEVRYTCEICGKVENTEDELDSHMKTVHISEMYQHFRKTMTKVNSGHRDDTSDHSRNKRSAYSYQERNRIYTSKISL